MRSSRCRCTWTRRSPTGWRTSTRRAWTRWPTRCSAIAATGKDPFAPARLHVHQDRSTSPRRSTPPTRRRSSSPGSGMMTGGRILHHLRAHLDDTHTTVMIVGFQPTGGLGRLLVDGRARGAGSWARPVRLKRTGGHDRRPVGTRGPHRAAGLGVGRGPGAVVPPRARRARRHSRRCAGSLRPAGSRAEIQPSEVRLPGPWAARTKAASNVGTRPTTGGTDVITAGRR